MIHESKDGLAGNGCADSRTQAAQHMGLHQTALAALPVVSVPAVVLTLVFKYAPMGGVLIAFQKYNPFKGIWGSEWVGFKNFTRFSPRRTSSAI